MVIMIVAYKHGVDARQILPRHSRISLAPRACPGHRTGSFGPQRVRQNVGTALLKEHGRVIHKSGPQSTAFYAADRYRLLDVRNEARRRLRPAGQLPAEGTKKPCRLRGTRIVEALSVKVLRKSRVAGTLLHESHHFILLRAAS